MQEIQTKVNSTTIMRLVLGGKEWHPGGGICHRRRFAGGSIIFTAGQHASYSTFCQTGQTVTEISQFLNI